MKILKKRAIAAFIDSFLFGSAVAACQLAIPDLLDGKGLLLILLFIPFFCRDFLFLNASIGKKIMGIAIYDRKFERPKLFTLFKRSFLTATVGFALLYKAKFVDGSIIGLFDFEREKTGTFVIDKKVYKKLEAQASEQNSDFAKNMTELYNAYLRDAYPD